MYSALASAGSGSWSSESAGGTLTLGKMVVTGKPVSPASSIPARAKPAWISWKVVTSRPAPVGFIARICCKGRCLSLPSMAGQRPLPAGFSAHGPYFFEYYVSTRGVIYPPLTILSNQLSLGYVTPP
ncbi:flagellar protein FlhE [Pantoea agglomerans]|nr:flagellar protein FlhE [Pantoea agglomerans]NEH06829.1 flagellar protein FlhE [Pantoea agglomerans]